MDYLFSPYHFWFRHSWTLLLHTFVNLLLRKFIPQVVSTPSKDLSFAWLALHNMTSSNHTLQPNSSRFHFSFSTNGRTHLINSPPCLPIPPSRHFNTTIKNLISQQYLDIVVFIYSIQYSHYWMNFHFIFAQLCQRTCLVFILQIIKIIFCNIKLSF